MTEETTEVKLYQIQYTDNTYRLINLFDFEWHKLCDSMVADMDVCIMQDSILVLRDIRAVVYIPPAPEPTEEEKAAQEDALGEWDFADVDTTAWLREQGIGGSK